VPKVEEWKGRGNLGRLTSLGKKKRELDEPRRRTGGCGWTPESGGRKEKGTPGMERSGRRGPSRKGKKAPGEKGEEGAQSAGAQRKTPG